jgi:Zn2+/Cd2+-exporting ATPase
MRSEQIDVRVANLDCESDAATLQRGLKGQPGVVDLQVWPKSAKLRVVFDGDATSRHALEDQLRTLGFPPADARSAGPPPPWKNAKVLASAASGVLLLGGWLSGTATAPANVQLALYLAAAISGGYYFGREAFQDLVYERSIGIEMLMATAAIIAIAMGEAGEGAMLAFLYSISEAAEGYTEGKTRSAIRALMDLAPKTALVRRDGAEIEVPVEELASGDVFIVKPGQGVATDGEVIVGRSALNQAPVTGESVPVDKAPGDTVFAGSINGEGALEVRATKPFAENTISRIIHLVEEAQEKTGQSERFIERFGHRYSPLVLLAGLLIAVLPPLLMDAAWADWIRRATVFIVAAAPCALVISVPITLVATLGTAARNGVLIKGGIHVEELGRVRVVALDKTGTITRGEPEVTEVMVWTDSATASRDMLARAAAVERRSQHPLARAIVSYAESQQVQVPEVANFQSLTGAGASGDVDGMNVIVGSPDYFATRRDSLAPHESEINRLQQEGKTVVLIGTKTDMWGAIAIRDNVRPNARQAIADLHAAGIQKIVMLTGDNARTAHAIAREAGIDEVHADLKPEDKAVIVRRLADQTGHVLMVGDGVNDAPALAEASVGVAMGAAGTDVALETADVALMADDLSKLVYALKLAQRNQRVVRQNLALSIVVIAVLVVGALGGWFTLPIAVIAHEISEFVVIGSGLRMLRA